MTSPIRAFVRMVMFAGLVIWVIAVQSVGVPLKLPVAKRIPNRFWRVTLRASGIKPAVRGKRSEARPILFVANHCSYLDIIVLGALIDGAFVAKTEVRGWPVIFR